MNAYPSNLTNPDRSNPRRSHDGWGGECVLLTKDALIVPLRSLAEQTRIEVNLITGANTLLSRIQAEAQQHLRCLDYC